MANATETQKSQKTTTNADAADLVAVAHRVDQLVEAMNAMAWAQQQQRAQEPTLAPVPTILQATMVAEKRKPLEAKRDALLLGVDPRTADIVRAARHAADVELAFELGIVTEERSQGMSPWAIAGIAVGAAAVGAGAAVGISYLLNKEGGES